MAIDLPQDICSLNMELLIPGLILVALMVWASTKIKRSAAQAYAAESIETEYFAIEKPDGLIDLAEPEDRRILAATKPKIFTMWSLRSSSFRARHSAV
mgnify:CR=1 FL=1